MESEPVVTSVTLSDVAILEQGTGKWSLIGCFNSISLPTFPFPYPPFFATVGLTNLAPGGTKIALTIRIEVEATGHVIASAGGQIDIGIEVPPGIPASNEVRKIGFDIPIRFNPVVFPQPGAYSIVVLINNEVLQRRNLIVQSAPPQSSHSAPKL